MQLYMAVPFNSHLKKICSERKTSKKSLQTKPRMIFFPLNLLCSVMDKALGLLPLLLS